MGPFIDPAWQVRGGGENPGMGEGSVTRQGDGCCSKVWFWIVLANFGLEVGKEGEAFQLVFCTACESCL